MYKKKNSWTPFSLRTRTILIPYCHPESKHILNPLDMKITTFFSLILPGFLELMTIKNYSDHSWWPAVLLSEIISTIWNYFRIEKYFSCGRTWCRRLAEPIDRTLRLQEKMAGGIKKPRNIVRCVIVWLVLGTFWVLGENICLYHFART